MCRPGERARGDYLPATTMPEEPLRPIARASMLVRKPAAEVYEAFIEPAQLTRFWLARASARLSAGASVEWEFMVPGARDRVSVRELLPNERIAISWSDGSEVEWTFAPVDDGSTIVSVRHSGFSGDAREACEMALESTQGFTIVLCALKALLETGSPAQLVHDKAKLIELQARKG
jgi:uncharacterized protein YndB with AHSA1/START domain